MRELLALCGYDEKETADELSRVQKAFARLQITDDDIARAKLRLHTYYDLESSGVRQILGIFVRDIVDIALTEDDGHQKVVHNFMAPGTELIGSAIMSRASHVRVANPAWTFLIVMGSIFGKLEPILEAAERTWLKSGVFAHCGNVKLDAGMYILGVIPMPSVIITSGMLCDTSSKSHDLLHERYGVPALYYDCWQDREWTEYPKARRATTYLATDLRRLVSNLQEHVGFEFDDQQLWQAIDRRKSYAAARDRLNNLVRTSDPVPLGSTHLALLFALDSIPLTEQLFVLAVSALNTLCDELDARVVAGTGVTPRGAPRILSILPYHYSDPRWEYLLNQLGMAVVATDFEFASSERFSGAGVSDPADPYDFVAQMAHGAGGQMLGGRIEIIKDACKQLGVNGLLNRPHLGCRYVAGDAMIIRNEIMDKLGIPVLTVEWDNFDPRSYSEKQLRTRFEAFAGMMEAPRKHG